MSEAGFFDVLRDDPDDDVTRLVYADWLDDIGDGERGEFIRLAVRLDSLPEQHPEWLQLKLRYQDLRLSNQVAWLGQIPESLEDIGWRGGLPVRVVFRHDAPAKDVEAIISKHPVGEVSVCGERSVRELARSPALGMIRSLIVRDGLRRRQATLMDRLIESPGLTRLRELTLIGGVDNYLARVIADSFSTRSLRSLRLFRTSLDDSGLTHLLRPNALPALEHWYVEVGRVSGLGMMQLFRPDRAKNWRSLYWPRLRYCTPEDMAGLGLCGHLRQLHIALPPGGVPGVKLQAWLNRMPELTELQFSSHFYLDDARELSTWLGLSRLKRLHIETNFLVPSQREEMCEVLLASPHYNARMKLDVTG